MKTVNGVIVRPVNLLYSLEMSETDTELRSEFIQKAIDSDNKVPNKIKKDENVLPQEIMCRKAKLDALGKINKINDLEKLHKKRKNYQACHLEEFFQEF